MDVPVYHSPSTAPTMAQAACKLPSIPSERLLTDLASAARPAFTSADSRLCCGETSFHGESPFNPYIYSMPSLAGGVSSLSSLRTGTGTGTTGDDAGSDAVIRGDGASSTASTLGSSCDAANINLEEELMSSSDSMSLDGVHDPEGECAAGVCRCLLRV